MPGYSPTYPVRLSSHNRMNICNWVRAPSRQAWSAFRDGPAGSRSYQGRLVPQHNLGTSNRMTGRNSNPCRFHNDSSVGPASSRSLARSPTRHVLKTPLNKPQYYWPTRGMGEKPSPLGEGFSRPKGPKSGILRLKSKVFHLYKNYRR